MTVGERLTLTEARCVRYTTHERLLWNETLTLFHRYVFRVFGEDYAFVYSGVMLKGVREGDNYSLRATLKRDERSEFNCWRLARVCVISDREGNLL